MEDRQTLTNNNKADSIYQALVDLVREGVYKPGDKLPNERELAAGSKPGAPWCGMPC